MPIQLPQAPHIRRTILLAGVTKLFGVLPQNLPGEPGGNHENLSEVSICLGRISNRRPPRVQASKFAATSAPSAPLLYQFDICNVTKLPCLLVRRLEVSGASFSALEHFHMLHVHTYSKGYVTFLIEYRIN